MLRLAADENFNGDIVRVQDVGLSGANDPTVLAPCRWWNSRSAPLSDRDAWIR